MYDLIVIGADLSSHVSAACASHHGLHTLLIAESGLGGLQLLGDFVFNIDPTPITGLGPDQLGLSILSELDITVPEADSAASINPAFQVILPDHRIDFYNESASLTAELVREFPELDSDITDFYRAATDASSVFQKWIAEHPQIQPQNFKEYFSYLKIFPHIFRYKFSAARFDKILSQYPSLEKVWEAQQALLSFNNDDLFSFASSYQYCAPFRGISYFPQGKQFLFNAFIEKLESNKGLYLNHYQVASITRNNLIEITIKAPNGESSQVSGRNLIISTKSDSLSLLKAGNSSVNISDWIRPAKIAYYPFTVYLGIAEKCLPEQIARHVALVTDTTKDIYDSNLIILEIGLPENNLPLRQARTSLTATVFREDGEENWTPDALKREAHSVLLRLEEFLPFLKENIELDDLDQSINISLAYRKVASPKYKVRNALLTSFAAKSNRTRFGNIFLTGTSLLADAGFDAELMSGKNAALQVINRRK